MEKTCYYKAIEGNSPSKEDCDRLHPNGCDDCMYFLPDPPKPDWDGDQDKMPWDNKAKRMTGKQISAILIIVLAIIAASVATGLLAGYNMYAWIVSYWMVLTAKNIVDYIAHK